jgi:hypothetical protein
MTHWSKRRFERISFGKSQPVRIMAIDASWQMPCLMMDISASGARLKLEMPSPDTKLAKEFYLLLSANGMVHRRCELVRVNGSEIGVQFVPDKPLRKPA